MTDQFGSTTVQVKKPELLYNPADENYQGISDPDTRYVGYKIKTKDVGDDVTIARVNVTNEFGGITLDVAEIKLLLVPSSGSMDYAPDSPDTDANHYQCYKTKITKGTPKFEKRVVLLKDQFLDEPKQFEIKKPKLLCKPAQKTHDGTISPIDDEQNHLLCYDVKPLKDQPKHQKRTMFTNNQFGPDQLDTKKEKNLCVPSVQTLLEMYPVVEDEDHKD